MFEINEVMKFTSVYSVFMHNMYIWEFIASHFVHRNILFIWLWMYPTQATSLVKWKQNAARSCEKDVDSCSVILRSLNEKSRRLY